MDGAYGIHPTAEYSDRALMSLEDMMSPSEYQALITSAGSLRDHSRIPIFGSEELISVASAMSEAASMAPEIRMGDDVSASIKAKIASHPRYPRLLQAYIDCQKVMKQSNSASLLFRFFREDNTLKGFLLPFSASEYQALTIICWKTVGAPPEIACLLDEIRRENGLCRQDAAATCLGADPELDEFMETYCEMLIKYKSDLSKPFDEATTFLNKIEVRLGNLCNGSLVRTASDDGALSSDEEHSCGGLDVQELQTRDEERDIKERLRHRFGSHISSLKLEFSKKKKKGKLPREARQTLVEWWNAHYKWPYPTEADKIALARSTGLDERQIYNWFINQRKRHWKPS